MACLAAGIRAEGEVHAADVPGLEEVEEEEAPALEKTMSRAMGPPLGGGNGGRTPAVSPAEERDGGREQEADVDAEEERCAVHVVALVAEVRAVGEVDDVGHALTWMSLPTVRSPPRGGVIGRVTTACPEGARGGGRVRVADDDAEEDRWEVRAVGPVVVEGVHAEEEVDDVAGGGGEVVAAGAAEPPYVPAPGLIGMGPRGLDCHLSRSS